MEYSTVNIQLALKQKPMDCLEDFKIQLTLSNVMT